MNGGETIPTWSSLVYIRVRPWFLYVGPLAGSSAQIAIPVTGRKAAQLGLCLPFYAYEYHCFILSSFQCKVKTRGSVY